MKIPPTSPYKDWQAAWPLVALMHKEVDPCQEAADFYLLDALRHRVLNTPGPISDLDLDAVVADCNAMFAVKVAALDQLFRQYVEMACGGELRHHPACRGVHLPSVRREAWAFWRHIHDVVGDRALLDMTAMFFDFSGGGFGGARWANAAQLLHSRTVGRISPAVFVDQVFQLVHNGGVFLNKMDWAVKNPLDWDLSQLQARVLPAQAQDGWFTLLRAASPPVRALWREYWIAANRSKVLSGQPPAQDPKWLRSYRRMCRCCTSNPAHGHLFTCSAFINGQLRDDPASCVRRVSEDDFGLYNWRVWRLPPAELPVGPDGIARMLPDVVYGLRTRVQSKYATAERGVKIKGSQLMGYEVKFVVFRDVNWVTSSGPYRWTLELMNSNFQVHLDALVGPPMDSLDELVKLVVPCRIALPMKMTNVDWTTLWEEAHVIG